MLPKSQINKYRSKFRERQVPNGTAPVFYIHKIYHHKSKTTDMVVENSKH